MTEIIRLQTVLSQELTRRFERTVALAFTGGLQGTGDTRSPLYISIVSQMIIPLGFCWMVQSMTTLAPHHVWIAIVFGHLVRASLSALRFRLAGVRDRFIVATAFGAIML